MAIEETITVDVAGLGAVDDLAGAFDKASGSVGKLKDELASLGGGAADGAGAGDIAAAWNDAAAKVSGSIGKIRDEIASLGDAGALAGGAGLDDLVAKYDTAAADISASMDKIAESGGKLDDLGEGAAGAAGEVGKLGDALGGVAEEGAGLGAVGDGIKGIGTSSDEAAAQVAALRAEISATIAETSAMQDKIAAGSADSSLSLAKGDAAMAVAAPSLATSSVEQDAAVAQQQAARKVAAQQAADDASAAEASATKYHLLALGGAAALAYGVDKAAQLQTQVTRLYTSAGESQASLPMDSAGILKLSGETNTSQSQLAQGAYMINSAGFHGQAGLGVLKAAAQGAQAEGAPLSEVGNALTSLMNAYGPQKGKTTSQTAMSDMNEIITMVGQGKMTMAGAVGALPAVLPVASAAHVSFPQVAGALATMTSMGMSPDWAAQNLRHTIGSLQNPNTVQTGEMQQLGLNPVGIAKNLGKTGITGTLDEIQTAVMKSMGPSGLVMLKTFNQSASAAQDATTMMKAMPPAISKVAQSYLDGTISAKQYNAEVFSGSESAGQKNLLSQFATTANAAHGFNAALKSGQPDAQVYSAAMSKILGGTVGLQTALMLTGQHAGTAKANVDAVAASAQHAGDNVKGWSAVQSTLNFQLGSFTKSTEAVATEAGQVALPALTGLMHGLSDVGGFLASNPGLTKPLVEAGGVLAGVAVAGKVASAGATALSSVGKVAETLHIPGLDKLANVGKGSAAGGMQTAADTNDAAAGKMQVAADTFNAGADKMSVAADESAVASEENLGAPVAAGWVRTGGAALAGEEAAGEEAAVAAGAGLKDGLTRTMGGLFAGGMVGSIAIPASMELDKLIQSRLGNSQASGLAQVGSGAAAGAATGAAAGSVIPGLGTAVGAIAGALIGGVTTALANHKVWDDLVQPPQPAKTPYVYEGPTPTPSPKPHGNAEPTTGQAPSRWADRQPVPAPAAPATFEWQVANRGDWARHTTASDFDHARHDASSVYDWMNSAVNEQAHTTASQFDSARHGVASIGHDIGSLFGWDAPAQKAVPAAPTQQPAQGKGGSWSSVTGGMGGQLKPLKIDAPDMSALTSAKGKAQADAQGITTAIDQALHKPVKMAAPDLATLTAAKGTAQSDGVAISAGLASGITAGGPAAVAAANSVAGQVEAAMAHTLQVRSPSKVTEKIGADTAAGLVVGLESGQTAVSTAAAALASGTAAAWKWSAPTITNTISTLKSDVTAAMKSGTVDASNGSFLTRMLTVDNQTLSSLAQKRYVLEAQIKAADAYAANVQSSAVSSASIVTVAGNITSADSSTTAPAPAASYQASDLISGEQAQLAQIRQFNTQVAQLKKEGLNTTELGQIIQSGAQTGLPIAQAITSGGKGAVAQLNAIQAQTNAAAKQLGITSANSMFESGTQIGAGLVAGLKSDLSGVESAIKTMAQQMVTTLEKELKIKSPSLVFAERGEMIPAGVAAGVVSGTPGAVAAVGRMGSQLGGDFHPGMAYASHGGGPGGGSGSGGGGGNTIINVTVNVAGSVSSQQDLVNAVTKGIRAKGGQNWQTGIIRPGRAG